ncbi:MAG: deoxynucleoside kinase [Bacilli bacterium]|jgi:deoxyguanosine kinase
MRIGINGPIGAGKSLLTAELANYLGYESVKEPVEHNEYLNYFYENKDTFSYMGQNAFYAAMFLLMWKTKEHKNVIFDSTFFSNVIYTQLLHIEGYMKPEQYELSLSIAREHIAQLPPTDLEIILVRDKEKLFANVAERGRLFELNEAKYLNFQYDHYYQAAKSVYQMFNFPLEKLLFLEVNDLKNPTEIARIAELVTEKVRANNSAR